MLTKHSASTRLLTPERMVTCSTATQGEIVPGTLPWFGRSVIRSCCKLDYGTAQRFIDGTISVANAEAADSGSAVIGEWLLVACKRVASAHLLTSVMPRRR